MRQRPCASSVRSCARLTSTRRTRPSSTSAPDKGRALILANERPFRAIIGVEFSPDLCPIARANLAATNCRGEIIWGSISDYEFPEGKLLVFFFNFAGPTILRPVLERLSHREATVIYLNAKHPELFDGRWTELRRGDTFEEDSSGFMPYRVYRTLPEGWWHGAETLDFQIGPLNLGRWTFPALFCDRTPLEADPRIPPVTLPLGHRQRRDEGLPALSFADGVIRYVAYRNKRRFVALSGTFDAYLTKFSSKTRGNLKRQVKYFTAS